VRGIPFELAENPPQNSYVAVAEVGPSEDSSQGVHDPLGVFRVQETDVQEEFLQVVVHSLDLLELRQPGWPAGGRKKLPGIRQASLE